MRCRVMPQSSVANYGVMLQAPFLFSSIEQNPKKFLTE
jgi:hypothetical protein